MRYQIIKMGPEVGGDRSSQLSADIREDFVALGLDPEEQLEELSADRLGDVNWKGIPVGVWFGGEDRNGSPALSSLLQNCAPVLPVVRELGRYSELVPDELSPINGRQVDDERIRGDVLWMLRLTRDRRQAFISYRRADSAAVAGDLHDAFSRRGYQVFLDTASVDAGAHFQDILWDRLAEMDLLVLLDSPNCLTSRWVLEELARVNNLGLGVVQLVWPGQAPYAGTEFSHHRKLETIDFVNADAGPTGTLTESTLKEVTAFSEAVRIRSLGARKRRVIDELAARLEDGKLQAYLQPAGPITIADQAVDKERPIAVALPVVGLPDARAIHALEMDLKRFWEAEEKRYPGHLAKLIENRNVRVVYDGLGIEKGRADHLVWLNDHLRLLTVHFDREPAEAADPLNRWLRSIRQEGEL